MNESEDEYLTRSEVDELIDEKLDRAVEEIFLYLEEEHMRDKRQLKKTLEENIYD